MYSGFAVSALVVRVFIPVHIQIFRSKNISVGFWSSPDSCSSKAPQRWQFMRSENFHFPLVRPLIQKFLRQKRFNFTTTLLFLLLHYNNTVWLEEKEVALSGYLWKERILILPHTMLLYCYYLYMGVNKYVCIVCLFIFCVQPTLFIDDMVVSIKN